MDMDQRNQLIQRLNDSKSLIDVLIQMESFMDDLDLYTHANWFDGEIVEGPTIKRYWVSMKLKYPYKKMPDPEGGLRLIKHGAKVTFEKAKEMVAIPIQSPSDYQDGTKKPKMEEETVWIVEIKIPRKFIDELDDSDLELYADEIDVDDVSDARDQGIDAATDIKGGDTKQEDTGDAEDTGDTEMDLGDEEE
jgi:hypothetical protein